MKLMGWAKRWHRTEGWDHRLRVMLGFDAQRIDWHRRNVTLGRLAKMWKSYLSKDAMERKDAGHRASPRQRRP